MNQDTNGYSSFLNKYRTNLNGQGGQISTDNYQQRSNYSSTQPQQYQHYGTDIDTSVLRAAGNVYHDEHFGNEILSRAGPSHHYQHPEYRTHEVISSGGSMENIQSDHEPLRIVKPGGQNVHYKQQVNVRFLEPPPGPEPAPIIIKERHAPAAPPLPPVVIRQRPPTPPTPPPLIIRERPPTPPVQQQAQIIEKVIPAPPAPPRQVIVERLPPPPPKPRQVIYEKWLPYHETKERPVVVHKAEAPEIIRPAKNVIIEYEQPKAHHEQIIVDEGVFRADPHTHNATSTMGEVRIVDKITDLPVNYSKYLTNRQSQPSASASFYQSQQAPQIQYSQTEPAPQYRSTTYNYPGAYSTTYRSSYASQNGAPTGFASAGVNGRNQSAAYSKYV